MVSVSAGAVQSRRSDSEDGCARVLYYINKNDELILLDYKTDYVEKGHEQELINKYETQLSLYSQALKEALGREVDRTYIYSVFLGKPVLWDTQKKHVEKI